MHDRLRKCEPKFSTLGSKNPLRFNKKFSATIKNSGFEVYTWFSVIDKHKTENLPCKNTAEKLQILPIKDENINAINCLGNVDIIEEHKGICKGIGKLKDFELTLHIDKSVSPVVQQSRKLQSEAEIVRKTY